MSEPTCVNLRQLFGEQYRVSHEQSYQADLGRGVKRDDRWLQIIECRNGRGHIFPWSETELAASVDRPELVGPLMALGCCRLVQHGDDGSTLVFHVANFDRVAEIMQPRRRRQLSAEQRDRCTEQLKAHRFKSADEPTMGGKVASEQDAKREPASSHAPSAPSRTSKAGGRSRRRGMRAGTTRTRGSCP